MGSAGLVIGLLGKSKQAETMAFTTKIMEISGKSNCLVNQSNLVGGWATPLKNISQLG